MLSKVEIYPQPDKSFAFDNSRLIRVCKDRDAVGKCLEPMLWPIIEPALMARKTIRITIEYYTPES